MSLEVVDYSNHYLGCGVIEVSEFPFPADAREDSYCCEACDGSKDEWLETHKPRPVKELRAELFVDLTSINESQRKGILLVAVVSTENAKWVPAVLRQAGWKRERTWINPNTRHKCQLFTKIAGEQPPSRNRRSSEPCSAATK